MVDDSDDHRARTLWITLDLCSKLGCGSLYLYSFLMASPSENIIGRIMKILYQGKWKT